MLHLRKGEGDCRPKAFSGAGKKRLWSPMSGAVLGWEAAHCAPRRKPGPSAEKRKVGAGILGPGFRRGSHLQCQLPVETSHCSQIGYERPKWGGKLPSACYMNCMHLHPEVQSLLNAMRALEAFLIDHDDFWAANVRRAADEIAKSDAHGLQRFLGLFGGMGSLNDLVLYHDGVPLAGENVQLASLTRKAWRLAEDLRHEIN